MQLTLFDVTARKVHQWAMVALVAIGFVASAYTPLAGAAALAVAGLVMVAGRFWWPADVFRQVTWRVLEPAGLLQRREVAEDHDVRRIARVLGGSVWLLSAVLLMAGLGLAAWALALAIAVMVLLDAVADFCALCFVTARLRR